MAEAATTKRPSRARSALQRLPRELTLLELVTAVSDATENEQEIIATVLNILGSGRVRLIGAFRDEPVRAFRR